LVVWGAGERVLGRVFIFAAVEGVALWVRIGADPQCPVCASASP
jgi:hypothetical protein